MKIVNAIKLLLLTVLTALVIAICSNGSNNGTSSVSPTPIKSIDCRTVKHQMGETQICGQPQRIVVLGPNLLEILLLLGVQPIGFGNQIQFHRGDYDNPTQQIPYLGSLVTAELSDVGQTYNPSIEAILKLKPDLILGPKGLRTYGILAKISPTLLFDWFDAETNLKAIAKATQQEAKAEQIIRQDQQRFATVRKQLALFVTAHPKILLLEVFQMQQITLTPNRQDKCSAILEDLGFQLVYPQGQELPQTKMRNARFNISLEILPQLNQADSVMIMGRNATQLGQMQDEQNFERHQLNRVKQLWAENAIAQSLKASKTGRVYFIPTYLCLGLPGAIGTNIYLHELQKQLLSSTRGNS
ncbi:MAG: iron-siderophore ABC transporter substrate-binding protein [Goleter apudmare HA4340-LM2]|nr:iron-siderophore ABC transporter substrate-binding protein [Goleter apudmare HA4340-LM2]